MSKTFQLFKPIILFILSAAILTTGCGANPIAATSTPAVPTVIPTVTATSAPTAMPLPTPKITSVELDRPEVPRYESIEIKLAAEAQYTNPYDARQVKLDGVFTGPDGKEMTVPGFWDGDNGWRIRFTPSQVGEWSYQLVINNGGSPSAPAEGKFTVTASDKHGWLQVGQWVNPEYSSHYLVYQDGTPFYGVGHGDALNLLADGFNIDRGVELFDNMQAAGENYVVWWPLYTNSPINNRYDAYSTTNVKIIDLIVKDAEKKGVLLIFTIWDHPELRGEGHAWGPGNWAKNGFSKLGDIKSFFISDEAWAWQENFYRYVIARWGYSPAIGMWQTVSEINGTSAYDQTDPWHNKVNAYFVAHDPYRHPTTASMSGDVDWPEGYQVMDAPQVHVYALENDAVKAAQISAQWTQLMWNQADKPNWVGEFGVPGNAYYPELSHNFIWAALASGAALTPAKWNDRGAWMQMTPEMYADNGRLAQFVSDIPLAKLNPSALQVISNDPQVRGWGVAGKDGGLFWMQDFAMQGTPSASSHKTETVRQDVRVEIQGLAGGTYTIHPYDTWLGKYLNTFDVDCADGQACPITLPNFSADMAFKMEHK